MNIAKQRHANRRTSSTSNSSDGDEPTRDMEGYPREELMDMCSLAPRCPSA
jgi:hypothetical protein